MAKWQERRKMDPPAFGVVPYENQVTSADTAPSPDAIQVPDDTPEHAWAPGRQFLLSGEPPLPSDVTPEQLAAEGKQLGGI
jgi:hypothetical protein